MPINTDFYEEAVLEYLETIRGVITSTLLKTLLHPNRNKGSLSFNIHPISPLLATELLKDIIYEQEPNIYINSAGNLFNLNFNYKHIIVPFGDDNDGYYNLDNAKIKHDIEKNKITFFFKYKRYNKYNIQQF